MLHTNTTTTKQYRLAVLVFLKFISKDFKTYLKNKQFNKTQISSPNKKVHQLYADMSTYSCTTLTLSLTFHLFSQSGHSCRRTYSQAHYACSLWSSTKPNRSTAGQTDKYSAPVTLPIKKQTKP